MIERERECVCKKMHGKLVEKLETGFLCMQITRLFDSIYAITYMVLPLMCITVKLFSGQNVVCFIFSCVFYLVFYWNIIQRGCTSVWRAIIISNLHKNQNHCARHKLFELISANSIWSLIENRVCWARFTTKLAKWFTVNTSSGFILIHKILSIYLLTRTLKTNVVFICNGLANNYFIFLATMNLFDFN